MIFHVADYRCGIGCGHVREIVPLAATLRTPGQPRLLGGFLNLRGDLVPVVSLRHLLGLPAAPRDMYSPVIIVKAGSDVLGLCVDRVLEVEEYDRSRVTSLPAGHSLNDFADSQVALEENSFVLLNPGKLLLAEERQRLAELSLEGRRRMDEIEASRQ